MVARDKEDLTGQQFGNYEIVTHLAARKVSDLFLARDIKLDRLVFLEVLRVTVDEDADLAERFSRRMEIVSQLKDPHIGIVSENEVADDGFPYAVTEYFLAVSLADKLSSLKQGGQTLPVIEALELAKQIAYGIGVAHSADLIHHDLRPENIMLRGDDMPVLIDLGVPIAAGPRRAGLTGLDGDMLDYTAPEELDGKPLTRRSNIYSIGVILYELLAGHRPMLPNLPFDIFPQANMPKEEPLEEARPGLAGETYRLVRNCLWRQEWSRYETADELITAIETAIFAEQELPKAAAWAPKRNRSMAIIFPLIIALVGIAGFFLLRSAIDGGNAEAAEPTSVSEVTPADSTGGQIGVGSGDNTSTPSATPTLEIPTESATIFSISVLAPGPNRQFTTQDTINFDWFWPTLPEPGWHFAVYLQDEEREYLLGSLTAPNNGAAYRLPVPAEELPSTAEDLSWQVRLEPIDGGQALVASDLIPIAISQPVVTPSATVTVAVSETPTPMPTMTSTVGVCVVSPPPGWVLYVVNQGDALSALAARANVPVQDLQRVNCLRNSLLSVGQQLWVPAASQPQTPTAVIGPTSPPATRAPQPTNPSSTSAPPSPTNPPPTDEPTQAPEPTKTPPIPDTPAP